MSYGFTYASLIDNGCIINYANLDGERGYVLEEDVTIDGVYYLVADKLDLNGHTMTINGDLIQGGGTIYLNGGSLIVNGNYRVQTREEKNSEIIYGGSSGILNMDNEEDYLYVKGDYINATSISNENKLTAGTIEIQGDVTVRSESNTKAFVPSKDIKIVLSGEEKQTIDIDFFERVDVSNVSSSNMYNCLHNLEMNNTSEEGICFTYPVYMTGNIAQGETVVDGAIILGHNVSFVNNQYTGDVYFMKTFTIATGSSIYGDAYLINDSTIKGNVNIYGNVSSLCEDDTSKAYTLYANSNEISILGNVNDVSLNINHATDVIYVSGNVNSSTIYIGTGKISVDGNVECKNLNLANTGTLEIKGDFSLTETLENNTKYDTTIKFLGNGLQKIKGAQIGTFDILILEGMR